MESSDQNSDLTLCEAIDEEWKSSPADNNMLDCTASLRLHEQRTGDAKGHDTIQDVVRPLQENANAQKASDGDTGSPMAQAASNARVCIGCKMSLGSGCCVNHLGGSWHPHCFCCYACHSPISGDKFLTCRNHPYHKICYKKSSMPKCDVCKKFVPTNGAGLHKYHVHPFWKQKYCPMHEMDDSPRCTGCERFQSNYVQHMSLGDGRKLCLDCLSSSIMDTAECQPLYNEILDFYERLNMKINQKVPVLLVEKQALNPANKQFGHHITYETRGLCLSEELTMIRRPKPDIGTRLTDVAKPSINFKRQRQVTAILILHGLPRFLTGSLLAHELMHAWLCLNGFPELEPVIEEGICQVMAHMWLESQAMEVSRNAMDERLREFFLQQIAKNSSPFYAEGFRDGYASVMQFGLRRTVNHIRMTGTFPL
ncbi:hypothetical protein KP509_11G042400 [Ceratopteris richardii]|uniref:LIM zinc-binding domain-containing protein n=2 Tax=Ceratopteris richardii TaxID=49495 RepID=A0A8T2TUR4_CERRI|nr:hypothetical protein KP509_11G042400 [Ceratopteris richardii]